jgi:methyl-accepting chemotaxis protein
MRAKDPQFHSSNPPLGPSRGAPGSSYPDGTTAGYPLPSAQPARRFAFTIKARLAMLAGVFLAGMLGLTAYMLATLSTVKVNGPLYARVVEGKDLVADVLPPPEYIIESYLLCYQMQRETNPAQLHALAARAQQLRQEYLERHAHWERTLPEGELRHTLLVKAHEPALAFFELRDNQFFPLLTQGQRDEAQRLLDGELSARYAEHRRAIDRVVELATQQNEQVQSMAAEVISGRTWLAWGLASVALALAGGFSYRTGAVVLRKLAQMNAALQALAAGDLSSQAGEETQDEVGQTQRLLNYTLDRLRTIFGSSQVDWESVAARNAKAERLQNIVEHTPVNIMMAGTDLKLSYLNAASKRTFKTIERLLPVPVEQLVGQSIDIFHKNPAHVRRILADPANLPHRAQIQLGDETLDLLVSPLYDGHGTYLGPMVTWEVITEKLKLERQVQEASERERQRTEELRAQVDRMLEVVSAAAQGDLTREVEIRGEDAVGQMGEGLARLLAELRHSIGGIASRAHSLASAADELSAVAQQMSSNSEETSAQAGVVSTASGEVTKNVQTVAAAVEEMTASIREIAKNASEAARIAMAAVKMAEGTTTTVSRLGEASAEIGQVIKVITSIAQQTNLLALNATIEAARAGEAGKGFAVVANEVKELAKETARATEDISQKIEAIQNTTRGAVEAIGQISGIIAQINDISNTIASAVEEQTATTAEIARNVTDAARGSGEIAQNITAVAEVARGTADGAMQTRRAGEELAHLAAELTQLVNRFRFEAQPQAQDQPPARRSRAAATRPATREGKASPLAANGKHHDAVGAAC